MAQYAATPKVAMQVSRGVVVASIQTDLDDDVMVQFQDDLLTRIRESGARAAILEVSGLETLDAHEFAALRRVVSMTRIMGADSILVGLRPGVVSALIEADVDVDGLRTAVDLDSAFEQLEPESDPESEVEAQTLEESLGISSESSPDDDLLFAREPAPGDER